MKKLVILLSILACVFIVNANNKSNPKSEGWSQAEIKKLQRFSLSTVESPKDISNKYLNNEQAIALGQKLFNDKRASSNEKIACSSCHSESLSFTDGKKRSMGLREGFRNTPTLLNVSQQHWFFADGAKDSLWAQALSSMENPAEQNFSRVQMLHLISSDDEYRKLYQQIFKHQLPNQQQLQRYPNKAGPNAKLKDLIAWKKLSSDQRKFTNLMFSNVGKAIAAYVSTIKSTPTRFDEFVDELNDKSQNIDSLNNINSGKLTDSEQRGLRLFLSQESACANCHSGPLFSNKSFHNIATGIPGYDNGRSEVIESLLRDEFNCLSKYSDAKPEECDELNYIFRDKHQLRGTYKTSTLRSISKTAPYMHDGRFDSLNDVIEHYITSSQKPEGHTDLTAITLTEDKKTDLINFLLAL